MKKRNHRITCLLFSVLFILLLGTGVCAAPAKVASLKASTSKQTVKLTWKKVSTAAGYEVYRVDAKGNPTLLKKTTKTSLTIKNCKYNTTYRFKVRAYDKKKTFGAYSSVVSATPSIPKPAAPKNFRLEYKGDKCAYFKWNRVSGVNGYVIEAYNSAKKEYVAKKIITAQTTNKAVVKNLAAGTTKFRILSYKTVSGQKVLSKTSNILTVKIVSLEGEVKSIRLPYYVVKTNTKAVATDANTGEKTTLKKGTKLSVTSKNPTSTTILKGYLSNNTPIKIKASYVTYVGLDGTAKSDYSNKSKEMFVNQRGLTSKTNYLIWVSQSRYKVNVFKGSAGKWKLVRSFPCCVGAWNTRTAQGFHRILKTEPTTQYGGPMIYFSTGEGTPAEPQGCGFHNQVDKRMSKAVSHGCVRMVLSDLYWIYNNCNIGTTVFVF